MEVGDNNFIITLGKSMDLIKETISIKTWRRSFHENTDTFRNNWCNRHAYQKRENKSADWIGNEKCLNFRGHVINWGAIFFCSMPVVDAISLFLEIFLFTLRSFTSLIHQDETILVSSKFYDTCSNTNSN